MSNDASGGLNDLFNNLNRLVDKLGELAEEGGEVKRTTRFGDEDDDFSGVFGVHIRTGIGDDGAGGKKRDVSVESFGNVREEPESGDVVVEETREPVVDVYDEGDTVRIVAEMPGVTAADVALDVDGDVCSLSADTDSHRYRKELLLPKPVQPDDATIRASNGIVEIVAPAGDAL